MAEQKLAKKNTAPRYHITIMAHKPAGVFNQTWYSVTIAGPRLAFSKPFADAKDLSNTIDELKAMGIERDKAATFEYEWLKESPELSFKTEEATVDWRSLFTNSGGT